MNSSKTVDASQLEAMFYMFAVMLSIQYLTMQLERVQYGFFSGSCRGVVLLLTFNFKMSPDLPRTLGRVSSVCVAAKIDFVLEKHIFFTVCQPKTRAKMHKEKREYRIFTSPKPWRRRATSLTQRKPKTFSLHLKSNISQLVLRVILTLLARGKKEKKEFFRKFLLCSL